jgi:hypothetical protein
MTETRITVRLKPDILRALILTGRLGLLTQAARARHAGISRQLLAQIDQREKIAAAAIYRRRELELWKQALERSRD